jgi:DNA-binding transcriptional LysR family regulator
MLFGKRSKGKLAMDRFRTMQSFVRVVRAGSFTLAANQLGLSRTLVSRHVSDLEARLGVRLLNRSTRALDLTQEGRQYLDFCEQMFRDLEHKEDEIARVRAAPAGTLRILAPSSFGTLHIADAVIGFAKVQPRLKVSLLLENTWFRQDDFSQRGLDIALRFAPIRKSAMIAERIAEFNWVVCAAPDYIAHHGRPQKPADLAAHACLIHNNALPDDHIWRFEGPKAGLSVRVNGAMYSNSALALRKASLAGLGVALVPRYAVAEDLASGALISLLNRFRVPSRMLFAIYPEPEITSAKLRVFIDYLTKWMVTRGIGRMS